MHRQEYTEGCQRESAVLDGLKKKLDQEEQQRLVVLPNMVQKEHEAAIRDIAELRWLVSFNDRERHRVKNRLDGISECVQWAVTGVQWAVTGAQWAVTGVQ